MLCCASCLCLCCRGEEPKPSVAAVVGSLDVELTRYASWVARQQDVGQEAYVVGMCEALKVGRAEGGQRSEGGATAVATGCAFP